MVPQPWSRKGVVRCGGHQVGLQACGLDVHACLHACKLSTACSRIRCTVGRVENSHMPVGMTTAGFWVCAYTFHALVHTCMQCMCDELWRGTCLLPTVLARHVAWSRVLALHLSSFSADPPYPPGISCLYCVRFSNPYLVTFPLPSLKQKLLLG